MRGAQSREGSEPLNQLSTHALTLTRLSLSPHGPSLTAHFPPQERTPTTPAFHPDQHHFTPAFILPQDAPHYAQNLPQFQLMHQRKVLDQSTEKTQLFVPRPSRANSHCCICHVSFEDYLQHVTLPTHTQRLQESPFRSDIEQLCQTFGPSSKGATGRKKIQKRRKGVRGRRIASSAEATVQAGQS